MRRERSESRRDFPPITFRSLPILSSFLLGSWRCVFGFSCLIHLRHIKIHVKMLCAVILALLVLASAKPTHGPLGVEVKEKGKLRIGVDGTVLHINGNGKCTNDFTIWYPVTEVTVSQRIQRKGYCPCYVSPGHYLNFKSSCPLKLDTDGLMEIDVDEAPKGCVVTIKNAFLAPTENSDDEGNNAWIIYVAVFVPISVLILLVVCGVVAWFCWRPRWRRARAARNAAAVQKTAVGAEVEDELAVAPPLTSVTSNVAISSVPASTGVTPVATAVPPPMFSTAPSTLPPTTSTTPEPLNADAPKPPPPSTSTPKPIVLPTSSANPVMPLAPTPAKPVPANPPKGTLQTYSTPVPIDQRPVHAIKKPVVVPPTSSGSSGRRRRKKLELSTEDFVEPDKVTGAPKPRKEPRKKRKTTTPEPARLPPPPPLTDEEPPPTLLSEREQRKRGRAEVVVDVLKASAKATAEDCCPDDSKRASTEATKTTPAKRPREKLVKFPLSDSRSQEKPEEVEEKARKASK